MITQILTSLYLKNLTLISSNYMYSSAFQGQITLKIIMCCLIFSNSN